MFQEFKSKIEKANNLQELIKLANYDEIRKLNPMNGEREDALAAIATIAYGMGKNANYLSSKNQFAFQ